ncbi:uncharacterized protein [Porites lutea]|uniref:uncharacterized protein n=1 Tax=Porites lutea TaxID=51062 RepID=UPI003CC598E0
MDFEQANHNLDLVQGFPGISNNTVWVTADSVPPKVEVVTRYPLSEALELCALVDCIRGNSSISFGLIVPEDSFMKPQMLSLGDGEHLRGELCAWNSSSKRIYRKPFDSSIACGKAKEIVFYTSLIREESVLSVFRDLKKEAVHLTINGFELKVSIGGCWPNFCYGYLRLSANGGGSKIRYFIFPEGEASDPKLESESEGEDSHPELELNSENESNSELESESELGDAEPGTDLRLEAGYEPQHEKAKLEAGCQPEQESQSELSHYAMDKRPHGICLLINNATNLPHVEEQVIDFFSLLAFEVQVRRGLYKYQVYKVAHEFARMNHNQFNLFVCVLMSVCEQDQEFCDVDGKKVAIEDLMSEYKPSVHSSLTNKPKLFFVMKFTTQRSKLRKIRSIPIDGSTTKDETPYSPCDAFEETCPKEADFLLYSVTSIVDEEMQDPQSSFIQVFANVTKQYGHLNYHLLELLVKVNEQLKNIGDGRTDGLLPFRVPYLTRTLRRRLSLEFARPLYAPLPACNTEPQRGNDEIHNGLKAWNSYRYSQEAAAT